jgi:hypothetical protein
VGADVPDGAWVLKPAPCAVLPDGVRVHHGGVSMSADMNVSRDRSVAGTHGRWPGTNRAGR